LLVRGCWSFRVGGLPHAEREAPAVQEGITMLVTLLVDWCWLGKW